MEDIVHQKGKVYYSMGEVCEIFGLNPSTLRYWEEQFDVLKPHRNKKGNRLFTPQDVDNIKVIYHLLKEKKMKIEVARQHLKTNKKEIDRDAEIVERLMNVRSILMEIKHDLAYEGDIIMDDGEETVAGTNVISDAADTVPETVSDNVKETVADNAGSADKTPHNGDKPPFEEQTLFEMAVPHVAEELPREEADTFADDEPDEEKKPGMTVIEQTLF